jgi:hypothetical protein
MAHELIAAAFVGFATIEIPQLMELGVESVVNRMVGVQGTSPAAELPNLNRICSGCHRAPGLVSEATP